MCELHRMNYIVTEMRERKSVGGWFGEWLARSGENVRKWR